MGLASLAQLLLTISILLSKVSIVFFIKTINKIIPKFAFRAEILSSGDESCLNLGGGGGHKICLVQYVLCPHQLNN